MLATFAEWEHDIVPDTGGQQLVYEDVQVAIGGSPSSVAIAGDRAYLTEATSGAMLRVIDVAVRVRGVGAGRGARM